MLLSFKTHPATSRRHRRRPRVSAPGATGSDRAAPARHDRRRARAGRRQRATATKTVTGAAADTRYGPGPGADHRHERHRSPTSTAVDYPQNDPRDAQINSFAIPQLNQEAVAAKSAQHRHGLRRDVHQPRATSSRCRARWTRPGLHDDAPVEHAAHACTSSTAWARSSPSTSATPATGPTRSRDVVAWLHRVDAVFSTYRTTATSAGSARGELRRRRRRSGRRRGARPLRGGRGRDRRLLHRRRGGRIDPTGLVKGWAVERASGMLRAHGSANHAVNGGGDIQLAGEPRRAAVAVGISDPLDGARPGDGVDGRDFAVATSGIAERGAHIIDPFTGSPAAALASRHRRRAVAHARRRLRDRRVRDGRDGARVAGAPAGPRRPRRRAGRLRGVHLCAALKRKGRRRLRLPTTPHAWPHLYVST